LIMKNNLSFTDSYLMNGSFSPRTCREVVSKPQIRFKGFRFIKREDEVLKPHLIFSDKQEVFGE